MKIYIQSKIEKQTNREKKSYMHTHLHMSNLFNACHTHLYLYCPLQLSMFYIKKSAKQIKAVVAVAFWVVVVVVVNVAVAAVVLSSSSPASSSVSLFLSLSSKGGGLCSIF